MALDKANLVIAALREQISNLSFENAVFRADITILTDEKSELLKEKAALEEAAAAAAFSKDLEDKCSLEHQS